LPVGVSTEGGYTFALPTHTIDYCAPISNHLLNDDESDYVDGQMIPTGS